MPAVNHVPLLDVAPIKIREYADNLSVKDRGEIANELSGTLCALVWRLGYMEGRYGSGCGDQGHNASVKMANKLLRAVRKAIGYSYPNSADINV